MRRWGLTLALVVAAVGAQGATTTIPLEGDYAGHLQDVWWAGDTIWWAHTDTLVKTDLAGRILKSAVVGGHHAGLEVKDGRLFTAVCAFNGEPRDRTTPQCHVMIGEYAADTLERIEMHVLDINDRAGSFCFLADGTCLVGCLRHPALKESEVKFHHLDRDFRLIRTHVIDVGQPVSLGVEVIKRNGNDVHLFIYGGPTVRLDARTLKETGHYKDVGGQKGFVMDGAAAWLGVSDQTGPNARWVSKLVRKPLTWTRLPWAVELDEVDWFEAAIGRYATWPDDAVRAIGGGWRAGAKSLGEVAAVNTAGVLEVDAQAEPLRFEANEGKELGRDVRRVVVESEFDFAVGTVERLPAVDPAWKGGVTAVAENGRTNLYGLAKVGAANGWVKLGGVSVARRTMRLRVTLGRVRGETVVNYEIDGESCIVEGRTDIGIVAEGAVSGVTCGGDGAICSLSAMTEAAGLKILVR